MAGSACSQAATDRDPGWVHSHTEYEPGLMRTGPDANRHTCDVEALAGSMLPATSVMLVANRAFGLYRSRRLLAERLEARGARVSMVTNHAGFDLTTLEGLDAKVINVPLKRTIQPYADLRAVRRLHEVMVEERPSLVHAFNAKAALLSAIAARSMGKTERPYMVSTITGLGHGYMEPGPLLSLMQRAIRLIARLSDAIVFQNEHDADSTGLLSDPKTRMVPGSGVDVTEFYPSSYQGRDRLRILGLGRVTRQKGVREFFEAAHAIDPDGRRASWSWAGELDAVHPDGIPPGEFRDLCHGSPVTYLGFRGDLPELLRTMDLIVVPSWREGFSRAVIEGMASGLPVVTTDAPGCRDAIEHGRTGWLVRARDATSLASRLDALLGWSPEDLRIQGAQARAEVLRSFSMEAITERHIDMYAELGIL